jgi:hypothetical protein
VAPTLHNVRVSKVQLVNNYYHWAVEHNKYRLAMTHMTRAGIPFAHVTYARWVTLRARWVTLRARWVTLRARWVALRGLAG